MTKVQSRIQKEKNYISYVDGNIRSRVNLLNKQIKWKYCVSGLRNKESLLLNSIKEMMFEE